MTSPLFHYSREWGNRGLFEKRRMSTEVCIGEANSYNGTHGFITKTKCCSCFWSVRRTAQRTPISTWGSAQIGKSPYRGGGAGQCGCADKKTPSRSFSCRADKNAGRKQTGGPCGSRRHNAW